MHGTAAVTRLALSTHSQETSLSKKEKKALMKEQEAKQKNEAMINTARTTFPSDLDISYHVQ